MTKQQMLDLISLLQDNIDQVILQSPDIMDGLNAYGYTMRSLGDTVMMAKATTPRSEALQTSDPTTLATWGNNEETIMAGVVGSTPPESVLVGTGDTDGHATLKELAEIFGYVLTDQDIEAEPEFWNNAISSIFTGSVGILDSSGDFYLSAPACQRAYDTFASMGQGGSDVTIYYDADNNELPMALLGEGHGVYFTNDSAAYQQRTGAKKTLTSLPGVQGVQYAINAYQITPSSPDKFWSVAFLVHEDRWQESSISIPTATTRTLQDDTTITYTGSVVLSPGANTPNPNNIVTLGGERYWIIENTGTFIDGGTDMDEAWPTPYYMPPVQTGQYWYTQFISDLGGFDSTHSSGGGSSISLPEIPGVTHPVLGDTFEHTYPTEYAHNITDGSEVYVYIDSSSFSWSDWYEEARKKAEEDRGGDNPHNPGGFDEGDGHSPELPDDDGNNTGFTACYHPDKAIVEQFCRWLWQNPLQIDWSDLQKLFNNVMDCIISLHKIYVTPSNATGGTTIHLGYIDTHISCDYCDDTHIQLPCGEITIPEYFQNSMDYESTTSVYIFLPFIGFKELSPLDVIGKKMRVTYNIDIVSGACICDIRVEKGAYSCSIAQYGGNCAVEIPISSADHKALFANLTSMAVSAGAVAVSGGSLATLGIAGAGAGLNTALNSGARIERGGSISANVGELSVKKPFVMVKRHYNSTPYRYQDISGYPASSNVALKNCAGFTRVKEIHLDAIQATEREKQELEALLKGGVEI